jgi:hypothetical protein
LTFQGLKVQEHVCGDGVWRIERCPPLSNIHYSTIQKSSMKHCDAKIIAKRTVHGIPSPCYDGLWSNLKRFALICHKCWFYANDLTRCNGGIGRKYYVNRPLVPPSLWRLLFCHLLKFLHQGMDRFNSNPPFSTKEYEVTIGSFHNCTCVDFIQMMAGSLGGQRKWVHYK